MDFVYIVERFDYDDEEKSYGVEYITSDYTLAYNYIRREMFLKDYHLEKEILYPEDFSDSLIFTDKYIYKISKFVIDIP